MVAGLITFIWGSPSKTAGASANRATRLARRQSLPPLGSKGRGGERRQRDGHEAQLNLHRVLHVLLVPRCDQVCSPLGVQKWL
jgi:hypothetical protein